jgi:hypothetical protein
MEQAEAQKAKDKKEIVIAVSKKKALWELFLF